MPDKRPGTRTRGRPSVEEADKIDRLILETASKVLHEQGDAASLNAVAKAAGLSRKSVYARYPSREELFIAVVRKALLDVEPMEFTREARFEDSLRNYIEAALELISSSAAVQFQNVLASNSGLVSEMREEVVTASSKIFIGPLADLVGSALKAGEIAIDDPALAVRVIFNAAIGQAMVIGPNFDLANLSPQANARYARTVARTIAHGLLSREGTA